MVQKIADRPAKTSTWGELEGKALRESEQMFRLALQNVAEILWLLDPVDSRVLYISPAYEEVWGCTCQSLYDDPKAFLKPIHPEDLARVTEALDRQAETGEFDEEFRIVHADGSIRWVEDRGFAVKDEAGQVIYVVGLANDITKHKQLEDAFERSRDDLEARVAAELVRGNDYGLTFRELTVLHLVAAGQADKEIANELGITSHTASRHVKNILRKMNAASRTDAGVRAVREELIS